MGMTPSKGGLNPHKYTVTRNAEDHGTHGQSARELEPDEVFVLKRGDVLAVSALRSYVQNVLLMLDVDEDLRADGAPGFLSPEERDRLRALADDVNELAEEWERHNHGKLPD